MTVRECSTQGCAARAVTRGRCSKHYQSYRKRLIAYGRWQSGFVDAEPVRTHLQQLVRGGLGVGRIAELAGVSFPTVSALLGQRTERPIVRRTTAELLLAVEITPEALGPRALVDGLGARRRLQALVAMGWSPHRLAGLLSMPAARVAAILHGEQITAAGHDGVARLFDRIWNVAPPTRNRAERAAAARARNYASERRWAVPLAWDDIDTDPEPPRPEPIPRDEVDELAIELACAGERVHLTPLERRVAVARLVGLKLLDSEIAARLHIADRTVWRIRQEQHLPTPYMEGQVVA